jgi:hypothetical protein
MHIVLQLIDCPKRVVCFNETAEDESGSQHQAAHIHGNGEWQNGLSLGGHAVLRKV